jgi:hypothetical protein
MDLPYPARCALALGELVVDDVGVDESHGIGYLAGCAVFCALVEQQGEGMGLLWQTHWCLNVEYD